MSDVNFNHYFVVNNVDTVVDIIEVLKRAGVSEEQIGVVSRDNDIVRADLPQADLTEKSAIPQSLKRGALLGSGAGLLAGVLVSVFPVAGIAAGGAAIVGMTAGGAAFGSWSATMIGVSESSPVVKQFEDALDNERTLIFCELSDSEKNEVVEQLEQFPSSQYEFGQLENKH
ncbi:hypothetical protein [Alteromonas ponticola]|uniref:DUF1269 domain-containing protein n=1 Tax=Alteromonas ponticola TaxID=2720613 RepID=A0ABX1R4Z8_9ALTE|nr:hypothetical protein [Alteromonas ponticola]NMH61503.1 hypothetical protein [Alteromonas ponticola]